MVDKLWELVFPNKNYRYLHKGVNYLCKETKEYRSLADALDSSNFVLEIGCATGLCTRHIAKALRDNRRIFALDISEKSIFACRQSLPEIAFEKINVLFDWKRVVHNTKTLCKKVKVELEHSLIVFVDIGGNREIESLFALLSLILTDLKPASIIVKSEKMFNFGKEFGVHATAWESLRKFSESALMHRRVLETRVKRKYHPLKMPMRLNPDGVPICRYHNYDRSRGCLRYIDANNFGLGCEYDHEYCHSCLRRGHRAFECDIPDEPVIESLFN